MCIRDRARARSSLEATFAFDVVSSFPFHSSWSSSAFSLVVIIHSCLLYTSICVALPVYVVLKLASGKIKEMPKIMYVLLGVCVLYFYSIIK